MLVFCYEVTVGVTALSHSDPPPSAPQMLGFEACTSMAGKHSGLPPQSSSSLWKFFSSRGNTQGGGILRNALLSSFVSRPSSAPVGRIRGNHGGVWLWSSHQTSSPWLGFTNVPLLPELSGQSPPRGTSSLQKSKVLAEWITHGIPWFPFHSGALQNVL